MWDLKIGLWGKGEPELAEQFMTYWTRMAANGNPNTPIPGAHGHTPPPVIEWPVYNATTDETMVLDIPLATQAGLKKQYCDVSAAKAPRACRRPAQSYQPCLALPCVALAARDFDCARCCRGRPPLTRLPLDHASSWRPYPRTTVLGHGPH